MEGLVEKGLCGSYISKGVIFFCLADREGSGFPYRYTLALCFLPQVYVSAVVAFLGVGTQLVVLTLALASGN